MEIKKVLINEETIKTRIKQLAEQISNDYQGEDLTLVCVLKGSIYFFADLSRQIKNPTSLEFIRVSSYVGEESTIPEYKLKLDKPVTGKNVIVVEDIIDTGKTLQFILDDLATQQPKSLRLCTLLDKPIKRKKDIDVKVDYTGFTIPDRFVIGYGLDKDQDYRNLPEIYCFIEENQIGMVKNEADIIKLQLTR